MDQLRHAHAIAAAIQRDADAILKPARPKSTRWGLSNQAGVQMRLLTNEPLSFRVKGLIVTVDEAQRLIVIMKSS